CFADCGQPQATETVCGDGIDGDRDGLADCLDTDCRLDPACAAFDYDGDGYAAACDCDDASSAIWGTPGEVRNLFLRSNPDLSTVLPWTHPSDAGAVAPEFDTVRATGPAAFATAVCVPPWNPTSKATSDAAVPAAGGGFYYLVRAKSACPAVGPLGS